MTERAIDLTDGESNMKNDLISRQALCEYALNQKDKSVTPNDIMRFPSAQPKSYREGYKAGFKDAQSERKRGKWVPYRCDMYKCSECGYIYTELTDRHRCGANYCPNCGADMRKDEQE